MTHAMQFLGGISLLTGPTDEHWKLVRKAVAPAFSQGNMRCGRPHLPPPPAPAQSYVCIAINPKSY